MRPSTAPHMGILGQSPRAQRSGAISHYHAAGVPCAMDYLDSKNSQICDRSRLISPVLGIVHIAYKPPMGSDSQLAVCWGNFLGLGVIFHSGNVQGDCPGWLSVSLCRSLYVSCRGYYLGHPGKHTDTQTAFERLCTISTKHWQLS